MKTVKVPINAIDTSANTRPEGWQDDVEDLQASMGAMGLLQPIRLKKTGKNNYLCIVGHRRTIAAKNLGWESIDAIIEEDSKEEMLRTKNVIENIVRKKLDPISECKAISNIMDEYNLNQTEFSTLSGLSSQYISRRLNLLRLPGDIQEKVKTGVINIGEAEAILQFKDKRSQKEVAEKLEKGEITTGEAKATAELHKKSRAKKTKITDDLDLQIDERKRGRKKTFRPEKSLHDIASARSVLYSIRRKDKLDMYQAGMLTAIEWSLGSEDGADLQELLEENAIDIPEEPKNQITLRESITAKVKKSAEGKVITLGEEENEEEDIEDEVITDDDIDEYLSNQPDEEENSEDSDEIEQELGKSLKNVD